MKKLLTILTVLFILFSLNAPAFASDVSALQFLYLVKQVFPETKEVSLLVSSADLEKNMSNIERASAMFQIKVVVRKADNSIDIGKAVKNTPENSLLVMIDNELFENNKNKLYILSKCKEKQVSLVTSSRNFIDSGALLGYIPEGDAKKVVVNLKHYGHLQQIFTEELVQKLGIAEIIS